MLVKKIWYVVRLLGFRVIWLRLGVYADKFLGRSRIVFASRPLDDIDLKGLLISGVSSDVDAYAAYKRTNAPVFLFPLGDPPAIPDTISDAKPLRSLSLNERRDLLDQMRCVYFGEQASPEQINWYHDPFHGGRSDPKPIWCDIPCYLPEQGDPRMLWEPSRAAWAIDIARIAARGAHEDPAELLWRWIDDWMDNCPPFHGFQWWCGQESSVRFFAIAIGVWTCGDGLTSERWRSFARLAWATGYRVYHHINYAISQKNNHAFSEAVGLMMIGHLFPEFRDAAKWSQKGREVFASELRRQCYLDGTYLQQSHNYHRVMLQDAILGVRIAELSGKSFDEDIYSIVDKATEFLFQTMDTDTGLVPLYGNNDGAHVLPLSECEFMDFRPVVQAGYFLVHRKRLFPAGIWDEDTLWLMSGGILDQKVEQKHQSVSRRFDEGGYYTLRRPEDKTWMLMRCHSYKDRQGHQDALHIDLWWRGVNILRDAGTYQYYIPGRPDMENYFSSMAAHNVVQIDGVDALEKVGRFLIFPWGRANVRHYETEDSTGFYFEGQSEDYDRVPWNVLHRRAVLSLTGGRWVIVDDLIGDGEHAGRWWWHLADGVVEQVDTSLQLNSSVGVIGLAMASMMANGTMELIRGRDEPGRVQGFASPSYGRLDEASVLQVDYTGYLPIRVMTVIAPGSAARIVPPQEGAQNAKWSVRWSDFAVDINMNEPKRDASRMLTGWRETMNKKGNYED